jgi:nucleoside phosphorylase
MRVLVTFAVEAEFAPWRKLRSFARQAAPDLDLWKSVSGAVEIFVLLTGIGERSTASVMDLMMRFANTDRYFEVCISSGLAGALLSCHKVGDVLAAQSVRTFRVHADLKSDRLASDALLVELAISNRAKCVATFYSAERVITTAKEKMGLAAFADAVDMESFEVIKEAAAWGSRGIAIRAISDGAETDLPIDFNRAISSANQVSIPRVLCELAKHPSALPGLIEFGKQSRKAAELLARFLDAYVGTFSKSLKLQPCEKASA